MGLKLRTKINNMYIYKQNVQVKVQIKDQEIAEGQLQYKMDDVYNM